MAAIEPGRFAAAGLTALVFDGAHFDIYVGERFEWAVGREIEFLRRAALLSGVSATAARR